MPQPKSAAGGSGSLSASPEVLMSSRVWSKRDVAEYLDVCEDSIDDLIEYEGLPLFRPNSMDGVKRRIMRFHEYAVKKWFFKKQRPS